MTAIEGRGGLLGVLSSLRRQSPDEPPPDPPRPGLIRRPVGYIELSDAERVLEGFLACVMDIPGVRRVSARTSGPTLALRVTVDGVWHEAIDEIEPRIHPLVLASAVPFDYTVVEAAWGECEPPGFVGIVDFSAGLTFRR